MWQFAVDFGCEKKSHQRESYAEWKMPSVATFGCLSHYGYCENAVVRVCTCVCFKGILLAVNYFVVGTAVWI